MKKLIIPVLFLGLFGNLNAQSNWSLGVALGSRGNSSSYSGGMADANARFHQSPYGTGFLGFTARKSFSEHWGVQTGIGFSSIGTEFAISNNYSLLNRSGQYESVGVSTGVMSIPASAVYMTKLNCRNWRWFVGGGFTFMTGGGKYNAYMNNVADNESATNNLDFSYSGSNFATFHGHLIGGIEKVCKKGGILSFGLMASGGFSNLITTDVTYTIDGTDYQHKFTNRGNFGGFYIAWYFRPLNSTAVNNTEMK